ncbi:MAG TPA: NAD-dependent epimerase/dehydratase family protein [Anaerolineaceae bacterium]
MKALVTGASGFIGAHLCYALLEHGWEVTAFHRPTSNLRLLNGLPVEHALGDITQPDSLAAALQTRFDAVFHTAAWMGSEAQTGKLYTVTVEGTRAVLQAARRAGVGRVVHTSSAAALGVPAPANSTRRAPRLLNENHTWNYRADRWQYAYAKYLAEQEVQKAVAGGLNAVIVNPSLVFGAGDIYRQSSSLVAQAAQRRIPALIEGGVNVVHVADVVEGHLAAFEHGRRGERYLLAGENLLYADLIRLACEAAGPPAPTLVLPSWLLHRLAPLARLLRPFLDLPVEISTLYLAGTCLYYDRRKAEVELGLPAPRPARQALAEAAAWFRDPSPLFAPTQDAPGNSRVI